MMRTTFRLFAAACLLTATLGCQPEADYDNDLDIDAGETPVVTTPDSNITGVAEVPETSETPLTTDAFPVPEATSEAPPEVTETPTVTEVEPTEPVQTEPEAADADEAAPQPVE
jgi:type IV secretory pathway VirB10-like protein